MADTSRSNQQILVAKIEAANRRCDILGRGTRGPLTNVSEDVRRSATDWRDMGRGAKGRDDP